MTAAALIMAGGNSDRMREGGCGTHKALRVVAGMSLLERNLRMLGRFQLDRIWVATRTHENELHRWLDGAGQEFAYQHQLRLHTLREDHPLGTIGAAGLLRDVTANVVVVNVDNLTDLDIGAVMQHHFETGAAATVAVHDEPFRIPFGEVRNAGGRLVEYLEKPQFKVTISSGVYVLHRQAISLIEGGVRTDAPALFNSLIATGAHVACFSHTAWWTGSGTTATVGNARGFRVLASLSRIL
jgi:NDP-sugar pyrophosphorylase family protein